jgi:hypothetical protein
MSVQRDYWQECIAIAAEECDLTLTPEQLDCLAGSAKSGHENYGMAFYSPPPSERIADIEAEWKERIKNLQAEFDAYRGNAETAVKLALRVHSDEHIGIGSHGEVTLYAGRCTRIQ